MLPRKFAMYILHVLSATGLVAAAFGQDSRYDDFYNNGLYASNWNTLSSKQRLEATWFTTPAYRKEAFDLVLAEADQVAAELKLEKELPITKASLTEAFIGPPIMEIKGRGVGNVTTKNYCYYVTVGNKLSSIVCVNKDYDPAHLVEEYQWPSSRINTNAAYKLAVHWMSAASMDVKQLNHDCQVHIEPVMLDETETNYFVPIYHVSWGVPADNEYKWHSVASVALFLPNKMLLDMTIQDSKYILRPQIIVKNTDYMSNLVRVVSNPAP